MRMRFIAFALIWVAVGCADEPREPEPEPPSQYGKLLGLFRASDDPASSVTDDPSLS
jgi:hypothetical protein